MCTAREAETLTPPPHSTPRTWPGGSGATLKGTVVRLEDDAGASAEQAVSMTQTPPPGPQDPFSPEGQPGAQIPPGPQDSSAPHEPPGAPPPPGSPPPPGPSYQQAPPPSDMRSDDERMWATIAHAGSFVAAWAALGVLCPLIVLLAFGNRSPYVRHHAVESLNFQITMLIGIVISTVLIIVLIGIPLLVAIGIWYIVFVIIASVKANAGEWYRYPAILRLVR
jgi:uncharacterized protein